MARPVAPLVDPAAVHNTLARLAEGETVPREVYIADYADGAIPRWVLIWKKEIGLSHFALVFEDQTYEDQPPLGAPSRPRRGVLTSPSKSLCTQVYLSLPGESPWPAVNRLADLLQQARIEIKRSQSHA